MMKQQKSLWRLTLGILVMWVIGCGGGISEQARSKVTYSGSFQTLQQAPQNFMGEIVILGGKIIEIEPMGDYTDLQVVQLALNTSDRPEENDRSEGRFLIRSEQFLDPALYPAGTLITVVGQLQGSEERPIGQMSYRYPVITPQEIKKWPQQTDPGPRFHIGIGVGKTF